VEMHSLFEPVHVGAWDLANRIVMAPLTRNRSPGGIPGLMVAEYYAQRASAGLVVAEATAISPQALGYADVPGLYTSEQLAGWQRVTNAVHEAGGKIVVQLWHVGRVSHVELQPGRAAPVAPSALAARTKTVLLREGQPKFVETSVPRALEPAELPGIVGDFHRAAVRAMEEGGFDGVEIHAANGYLLDQFLRSSANRRDDAYGGSVANRARLTLEVAQAVAEAVTPQRTGIRLSPVSPANDIGDDDAQALFGHVVRELAPLDLAYVHVVEGSTSGPRELADRPFDYAALRAAYRGAGGSGSWMVNNGYDKALAQRAVEGGAADLVAFGKPFIANPDLVRRLRENAPLNVPDKSTFYGGGARGFVDYPALP
jgi:N-ethylmaleimide reductase